MRASWWGGLASLTAAGVVMTACAPALNWREWRPPGTALVALLPCKPKQAERSVPLAGRRVRLALQHCDAGGATWALAHADTGDPAQVTPALAALREAALRNIDSVSSTDETPARVPGMTPNPQALVFAAGGRRPDGAALQTRVALFAYGTTVWQATVLAPRLDAEALSSFFGALRFEPS